ncbi:MAG TPA: PhzF family phenazine biosynthesis protein [Thermoanaerobaculia bacterium]|nr:PhzF family phenazine biosynthesis protein [Thermoanaerobaculia bacterium]
MRIPFATLDVFTDRPFGGNPLAIVPDARGLSSSQMQRIANELNLSETAFVLPPENGGARRLRIFTPARELPFAGHPTVGAALFLAWRGELPLRDGAGTVVLEESVGPVTVDIEARHGRSVSARLTAAQRPVIGPPPPPREILAEILSLRPSDLRQDDLEPAAVSCGVPFVLVPLRDRQALARVRLANASWAAHLSSHWAPSLFVYTFDPELPDSDVRARMLGPSMGILEDPATGAAAVALAGYLADGEPVRDGTLRWRIEQGFEMGRPSLLDTEAEKSDGEVVAVRVGGAAVPIAEGTIALPPEVDLQGAR